MRVFLCKNAVSLSRRAPLFVETADLRAEGRTPRVYYVEGYTEAKSACVAGVPSGECCQSTTGGDGGGGEVSAVLLCLIGGPQCNATATAPFSCCSPSPDTLMVH